MTTLFAILAQFILNPTFEKVEYTQKERQTIGRLVEKSWYMKECSITWPIGQKKGIIILWMICSKWDSIQKARMWIDYKHKLYMKKYTK